MTILVLLFSLFRCIIAEDKQQDRGQACLPTGFTAAFAGCEAQSAEQPADGNPQRLSRTRSALDNG